MKEKRWDIFISHAGEDKATVARPLTTALRRVGVRVWLDEHELTVGDSLSEKIDEGLSQSRFGAVILSPAFFAKHWPKKELAGLRAREEEAQKVILPIWQMSTNQRSDNSRRSWLMSWPRAQNRASKASLRSSLM